MVPHVLFCNTVRMRVKNAGAGDTLFNPLTSKTKIFFNF